MKDKFGVVIEQGTKSLKDWKEQVIGMLAYLSNTVQGDWLSFAKRLKNIAPGDVELTDEQVRELRRNKELQDKLLDAKKDFFNVEGKIQSDYLEGEAAINAEYANKNIALIIDSLRERKEALEQINKTGVHHDVETPENKALALQILHTKQLTNETERLGAIAQLNDKLAKQGLKDRLEVADKLYNFQQELNSKEKAYLDKIASSQVDQIDRIKDARINALEAENAQGLAAKIHLESLKAAIEIDAIKKTSAIKAAAIQEDTRIEIEAIIAKAETLDQLNAAQATAIKIQGLANQLAMENAKKTADGIFKIQTSAVHKQVQLAEEQYTKIFNSLKTQAGGVFDALLTKASSVWAAIGNALKVAVLTAIKDIVTSRVAALLMKLFTGVNVTLKGKADVPGIFGKLGGILGVGAEPEFHFTTKLDEVNHLGDAVLINGALPVVLTSPMGGSPIDVGGGANLSSMVGGLAMGLGAIRGGGSAISSTIDYGAGAIPVTSTMSGGGVMPLPSPIGSTLSGAATNLATVAPVLAAISGQKGGGLGAVLSGAKMVGMLAGGLHGLKALIGIGGSTGVGTSIQIGAGQATTWGAATLGQKLGALGKSDAAALAGGILALNGWGRVGATKSGASNIVGTAELAGGGALVGYKYASAMGMTGLQGGLLGGGIGLTVAGLKKGGWTGVGMDVVGGAMAGFALGGPIGAAIGAAVGGVAGLVRMLFKGATQKVREKIKQIYKIDITSQGVLQQIVDIAKSAYGGNLNMAVRSTQVAELVKLYALTTDQNPSGLPLMMQASTLVQQNGLLFRQPETLGGRALNSLGGTIPVGTPSPVGAGAGGGAIILRLDGPATTDLLNGVAVQAIADNPRTVQGAVTQANLSSAGRRENTSLMFQPGLLTS